VGKIAAPSSVSVTDEAVRLTSLPPSTVSICRRALLSAGWLIARRLAVSVKWRSWARVTNTEAV
jgi:hypothetical protein